MILLVVASPCALVTSATPATLEAISNGAKHGVLFKGGAYLENFSQIKAIAFDNTGTLTKGKPVVTDFYFSEKCNREELINVIVAIEKTFTHTLAKAIVTSFEHEITTKTDCAGSYRSWISLPGLNIHWKIGKRKYMTEQSDTSQTLFYEVELLQKHGKTVIYVNRDNEATGQTIRGR